MNRVQYPLARTGSVFMDGTGRYVLTRASNGSTIAYVTLRSSEAEEVLAEFTRHTLRTKAETLYDLADDLDSFESGHPLIAYVRDRARELMEDAHV